MYYLETNAIIKLGKKLKTIVKSVKCYTSFLTILELLKNTSAQSYPGVRGRLKTIKDSGITIDWYPPRQREYSAYPAVEYNSDEANMLKALYETVLRSETFSEAEKISSLDKKSIWFSEIDNYMETMNSGYKELFKFVHSQSTLPGTTNQKEAMFKLLNNKIEGLDTSEIKQSTIESFRHLLIILFANNIGMLMGNTDSSSIEMISASYDGTINKFFDVLSYYLRRSMSLDKSYHYNDALDLDHFIYLQSKSCKIVSDDKLVRELGEYLGKRKCISADILLLKVLA